MSDAAITNKFREVSGGEFTAKQQEIAMSDELLPCPFCGEIPANRGVHVTSCRCGCLGPRTCGQNRIVVWNRRAESPEKRALEEAKKELYHAWVHADSSTRDHIEMASQRIEAIERGESNEPPTTTTKL